MDEEEVQLWQYLAADGTQHGPVTADDLQALAAQGVIHPETEVWTEGLDQWVPATHVEGLLPPAAAAGHHPTLLTGTVAPPAGAHPIEPVHPTPGAVPAAPEGVPAAAADDGSYPPTPVQRASFGKFLTFLILGIVLLAGAPLVGIATMPDDPAAAGETATPALALMALGGGIGLILLVMAVVMPLTFLHRAWKLLQWGAPRTTPGKAVGLLFVPFFNLYWLFVAYYGLAKDWNRTMESFPDLQPGPRISEGTALGACICLLIPGVNVVGVILLLAHYSQICRGINFMAERAMHQVRAGGIHLY
ncbi:MAG: DUF4339 domain-containing protein [Akkermansiaceae bacterium]|nr:DUF4339 domain-containing protein [Akkermansiaceae bacterium]NNM29755.1 DUF4339 domain-containing protein [Akkermansiaceae bacterium]